MAEKIRALYARDWADAPDRALEQTLAELLDPQVVYIPEPVTSQSPGQHFGIDDVVRLLVDAPTDWALCRYVVNDLEEHGARTLVCGWVVAVARGSEVRTSFRFAHVWTSRQGRVVRIAAFPGPEEGRAAVGRIAQHS